MRAAKIELIMKTVLSLPWHGASQGCGCGLPKGNQLSKMSVLHFAQGAARLDRLPTQQKPDGGCSSSSDGPADRCLRPGGTQTEGLRQRIIQQEDVVHDVKTHTRGTGMQMGVRVQEGGGDLPVRIGLGGPGRPGPGCMGHHPHAVRLRHMEDNSSVSSLLLNCPCR